MSNKPKVKYNKKILRFPEDNIPKTIVKQLPVPSTSKEVKKSENSKKKIIETVKIPDICVPKLNSTYGVKQKIKMIEETKSRKVKNLSDVPETDRTTIEEKITKKMNFPIDKKIYKELISYDRQCDNKPARKTTPAVHHERVLRDRVPKLEDYYVPIVKPDYYIPVHPKLTPYKSIQCSNGFRVYQLMQSWERTTPE